MKAMKIFMSYFSEAAVVTITDLQPIESKP